MSMRIYHQKSAANGKKYYADLKEYYAGEHLQRGVWIGDGARQLGLEGTVEKEDFDHLIDNIDPRDGTSRLTLGNHANRRVLTDVTLSAPKSVSVMWGLYQDERLLQAMMNANLATMTAIEQDAQTRVNLQRGVMTLEKTRNIASAAWLDTLGRPVDDGETPPHSDFNLHVHNTVLNCTHTGDDRWTAVDLSAVVRDSGYYNQMFMSHLADEVQSLTGYTVERTANNFEITGVSREIIEKYSRRTQQIEAKANEIIAKTGSISADHKDELGAKTRDDKADVPMDQLQSIWQSRLTPAEAADLDAVAKHQVTSTQPNMTAAEGVDYAIKNQFADHSVVRKRQVVRDALKYSVGGATVQQVLDEVDSRPWVQEGDEDQELITTEELLAEEEALVALAKRGRGQMQPLAPDHVISRDWLSDEQKNAVTGLLTSIDRISILRGVAGGGKTTLLEEIDEATSESGRTTTILAPAAQAAGDLRDKEGFSGAATLASFLLSEKAQAAAQNGVIILDESGLVGMNHMSQLASIAEKLNAKLFLVGDRHQHKSVAYGEPLRLLESEAGIKPHEITTIRRQTNDAYRHAVTHLSQGRIAEGFDELVAMDQVHAIDDNQERNQAIAQQYADNLEQNKDTLVVVPAHAEREQVTETIRNELKSRGHIDDDERELATLQSRRLKEAQRADPINYTPGEDIIEFHRRCKGGWKPGDRVAVAAVENNHVYAQGKDGLVELPINAAGSFAVYRVRQASFAAGDVIRISKNRKPVEGQNTKQLYNGSLMTIDSFGKDGTMYLRGGQKIDPRFAHFEHGRTVTSFAAQGKTYPRVIIAQSSLSFPASSNEQAYVSASRGREQLDWFTDSIPELRQAITRDRETKLAIDLKPKDTPEPELKPKAAPAGHGTPSRSVVTAAVQRAHGFARKQLQRLQHWIDSQRQLQYGR